MGTHAPGPAHVGLRFERSARFWMRAYPRRWRVERGDEMFGLLLDLAAPDAHRVDARAASDLVRGGWITRWRLRPPVQIWLLYRGFDRRIPSGYRGWAQDDIEGLFFPLRSYLASAWWLCAWFLLQEPIVGAVWWILATAALSMIILPEQSRRRQLLKHVAPQVGEPVAEGNLVPQPAPRRRVAANPCLTWSVAVGALLLVAGLVTTALAPIGMWAVPAVAAGSIGFGVDTSVGPIVRRVPAFAAIGAALLIGLWCARIARRRLLRWLDAAGDQPYRVVLSRVPFATVGGLVVGLGAVLGWMAAEAGGALPLAVGVIAPVACALLLPGVLVALRHVRRTRSGLAGTGLAGSDVWSIVVHGRPPATDVPLPALRPLVGPVPAGAVMVRARLGEPLSVALPALPAAAPEPPAVALP